jgi:Ca2+-binding RTX toxin-like protein
MTKRRTNSLAAAESIEKLETRVLLAIDFVWNDAPLVDSLSITGTDNADQYYVGPWQPGGMGAIYPAVWLNTTGAGDPAWNGRDDENPDVVIADVEHMGVTLGKGNDHLVLTGLTAGFTALASYNTIALGEEGNDTIEGSRFYDILFGDDQVGNLADFDDSVVGNGDDDALVDFGGQDTLLGGSGYDTIIGGDDGDSIQGGDGDTVFGNDGADNIHGGDGVDYIQGNGGNDTIVGGNDGDVISGGGGADEIFGDDDGSTNVDGNDGNDIIWGGGDAEVSVPGNDGADVIYGGGGNDTIYGDEGTAFSSSNSLSGANDDWIWGDYFEQTTVEGSDSINGEFGDDKISGGGEGDTLSGGHSHSSITSLSSGDDHIWGGDGKDVIEGHEGDDQLQGGNQSDSIRGGAGVDTIWGEDGCDTLYGDAGADSISGGPGDDTGHAGADNTEFDDLVDGGSGKDTIPPEIQNDTDEEEDCEEGFGPQMLQGGPVLLSDNIVGYRDQRISLGFLAALNERELASYLRYYRMTDEELGAVRQWRELFVAGNFAELSALWTSEADCGCGDWSM